MYRCLTGLATYLLVLENQMGIQEMQQVLMQSHYPPEVQSVMRRAIEPSGTITAGWLGARAITEYFLTVEKQKEENRVSHCIDLSGGHCVS